jgi:hypothetical protein
LRTPADVTENLTPLPNNMFDTFAQLVEASQPYLRLCDDFITKHDLKQTVTADHICFKCQSSLEYERVRALLERDPPSRYCYQVWLAGRRVAYLGFRAGLVLKSGLVVMCIELADIKPSGGETPGFHHMEIYPSGLSYGDLVHRLEHGGEQLVLKTRPHHTTHDIQCENGFIIRLTDRPLIKKIIDEELSKC